MGDDLDQLVQSFKDFFVGLYRANNASGGDRAFLAFEPIGTALTPDMFTLDSGDPSAALAIEQFSSLANTLPVLDGETIKAPSVSTVDGLYDLMVESAQPLPSVDRGAFDKFRRAADESFDRGIMTPLLPTGRRYCPATATPPDWWKPGAPGWTLKTFTKTEVAETTVGAGAPPPRTSQPWGFRVLPGDLAHTVLDRRTFQRSFSEIAPKLPPAVAARPAIGAFLMKSRAVSAVAPMRMAASMSPAAFRPTAVSAMSAMAAQPSLAFANIVVAMPEHPAPPPPPPPAPLLLTQTVQLQALNAAASAQATMAKTLSLSFDYCMVAVTRPWLSPEFLEMKNWFIPGSKAGEIASGNGTGEAPFDVIPMAALIVKNFTAKADWSQSDQVALQSSLALGPFSLVGRTIDAVSGELTCPGMQIVAWICESMTTLPPANDPAL